MPGLYARNGTTSRAGCIRSSAPRYGRVRLAHRFWLPAIMLFLLSIVVICASCSTPAGQPSHTTKSAPPPVLYRWSPAKIANSMTPGEALQAGVVLTPCYGQPAKNSTVTWLTESKDFGIAMVNFTCVPPVFSFLWFMVLYLSRGSDGQCYPQVVPGERTASSGWSRQVAVPGWLALPDDTYWSLAFHSTFTHPAYSVVIWYSMARTYIVGHFAGLASHPDGAATLHGDTSVGWMVQGDGLASVVVPLTGGTTVFVAGAAPASEITALASAVAAHGSESPLTLPPAGTQ